MCRIANNNWTSTPRAISVDEQTALVIDDNSGTVVGNGSVYFLQAPGPAQTCQPGTPLTYRDIDVYRIEAGDSMIFNFLDWTGAGGKAYTVSVETGALFSDQPDGSPY